MYLKDMLPEKLRKSFTQSQIDLVDQAIRESDNATVRQFEMEREAKGPEVAALAAAQVAADAERKFRESEALSKIAKAAAKSASKRVQYYRKLASKVASRASAADVDLAAKAAIAISVSQTAAVDEAEAIISENRNPPSLGSD